MLYYIFDYLVDHVYNHKDIKGIITDYYENGKQLELGDLQI